MRKLVTVRLEPLGKKIKVSAGTPLKDILFSYGVEFPCGGKGLCGGCRVRPLKGDVSFDEKHRHLLDHLGITHDYRLACQSIVTGDVTLEIGQFETFILADSTVFRFEPQKGYGIAFDLGATTLVAQLLNLETGEVVGVETAVNPQAKYGADVISRIEYAVLKKQQDILTHIIREKFTTMVNRMIRKAGGVSPERIVVVGNTVMHHLFSGIDVTPLSAYPFEVAETGAQYFTPGELGVSSNGNTEIVFLPVLGSFVGSDILAGIRATGLAESKEPVVLVDLGTNGEIVVGDKDRILCASTAAGPAFEGTNIQLGMRATTGAISSVKLLNRHPEVHVIGNSVSKGICGSGLIDAIAVLLKTGQIDTGGKMAGDKDRIYLTPEIFLTQKDVRELQLAKGAIATGLQILIEEAVFSWEEVRQVFISGAFGSFINLENTRKIGLFKFPSEKIVKMGNTALLGAKMLLFENDDKIREILQKTTHLSLETNPHFQDIFADNMMF